MTPVLAGAGAGYLFAPGWTLAQVFGCAAPAWPPLACMLLLLLPAACGWQPLLLPIALPACPSGRRFVKGVEGFFFWQAIGAGLMTVAPAVTYSLKARGGAAAGLCVVVGPQPHRPGMQATPPGRICPQLFLPCPCAQKLADEGRVGEAWANTLNLGVLAAAAGHLAGEFGSAAMHMHGNRAAQPGRVCRACERAAHSAMLPLTPAVMGPMVAANQGGPWLPWVAGAWATAALAGGLGLMGGAAKAATGSV